MGKPYYRAAVIMAKKLNEMALDEFDDLDTLRHCVYELWKRMLPGTPFPQDADVLRRRYNQDPEIKIVQSA